jgi:small-conductance mechanosensitive channel/CRP-like cAMP-binding protein
MSVLKQFDVSWTGFFVTLAFLVGLLFLRRLLPPDQSRRGRWALLLLALSLILRLTAGGLEAVDPGAASVVAFVAVMFMAFGVTGVLTLVMFDLILGRTKIRVPPTLRDLLQALVFAVLIIAILKRRGTDVTSLVTGSAVVTAVIGLALQSTISNLFAGLSLQMDRTISIGDWVHIGQRVGRITQIKWRSTFLVTRDGDNVIVPNSALLAGEVINYSKPTNEHRCHAKVGFHYRHPPNEVKQVLLEAVNGTPGVLATPEPAAMPIEFGDSAIIYDLLYWIGDIGRESAIAGEVNTRIWYAARRADLEIPFPIRSIYMTEVREDQAERERKRELIERREVIKNNQLFRELEPQDHELLARFTKIRHFAGGELIIRQGEAGDSLYILHSGGVSVRLEVEGAEREVAVLQPGDFFGEMSLMTGEPRRATCAALGDVETYVVDQRALREVLAVRPEVAERVAKVLAERQMSLAGERDNLSAEAAARRAAENSSRLLAKVRDFFNLA